MAIDAALFEVMTGPMKAANTIQQNRDAERVKELQLQEQEYQLKLREAERQETLQKQLNLFSQSAHDEIFNNASFRRQKDADDYGAWHQNYSGYKDIEQILKQYSSVAQAMQDPRLKQALDIYKQRIQTPHKAPNKGNPILLRARENFKALEQYKKYALDEDGYAKFLTSNSHQRFQDWQEGKTDNFIYTGVRGDYLDEISKAHNKAEQIDLDLVLSEHGVSIANDMSRDLGRPSNTFSYQDMKNWLAKELQYDASSKRFAGQAIYGEQDIETDYATELVMGIEATGKMGLRTGDDIFNLMADGISFNQAFSGNMSLEWDRLGGYDKDTQVHSTMGLSSPFSKGLQVMASGRVLSNDRNLETAVTNSWAGTYDDGKTNRYNSQNRQVYGVQMKGLYDRRGHKITDSDIASTWLGGKDLWEESETDNLMLIIKRLI